MINGAHAIVFSTDADADREFLRDVLALPHVDVGHGWLIFGLPPAELAVHPAEDGNGGSHELYLMCEDVEKLRERLFDSQIESSEVSDAGWGLVTQVTLPGGSKIGIYQPRHARPEQVTSATRAGGTKGGKPAKRKVKKAPARAARAAKTKKAAPKAAASKAKKGAKKKPGKRKG